MSQNFNIVSRSSIYSIPHTLANAYRDSIVAIFSTVLLASSLAIVATFVRPRKDDTAIETYYSARRVPMPHEGEKGASESISLIELMRRRMPSVFGPEANFKGVPWLPTGDAHTIYSSLRDFQDVDIIEYERVLIGLSDGGLSGLDISPPSAIRAFQPGEPIIYVTHGLTGGSHESYVRATLIALTAPVEHGGLGMRAVVQNSRGCNGLPILTPKLYNACTTDDIRHAILWIAKTFPGSPIYGIGFSLGANAITDYVGEEGDACPLSACVSVANPFDFVASNRHIETSNFITKYIYDYALGGALQTLIARHQHVFLDHPETLVPREDLLEYLAKRYVTMREFDQVSTRHVFGYKDAYDYYAHASSSRVMERIRIPYIGLNALDDPITGAHSLPEVQARVNSWVLLVRTKRGGHLGWFEYAPDGALRRWYVQPVREWLQALQEYNLKARPAVIHEDIDGWSVQQAKPHIRIRAISPDSLPSPPTEPALTAEGKDPVPFVTRIMSKLFTGW